MALLALALAAAPVETVAAPRAVSATATAQVEIIRLERVLPEPTPEARPLLRQIDRTDRRVDFY